MRLMDPLLPFLSTEFQVSLSEAGQTVTWFTLAYGCSLCFVGVLGDYYGKLRVAASASLICAATTMLCALAPDHAALKLGRLLSGAASSGVMTLAMAWLGDVIPYDRRQSALSRLLIGMSLGVSAGILVGGFAADRLINWRVVLGVLAAGFLTVSVTLWTMECTRTTPTRQQRETPRSWLSIVVVECRSILALPRARLILLTVAIEGAFYFGALVFIPSHLHSARGISLSLSGSVVMLTGAGGLFFSVCAPLFLQFGERRLVAWGGVVSSVSLLVVALAPWQAALPGCFFAGMGFYMLHSTFQAQATQMAPERRGSAVAFFSAAFFLGQAAGVAATSRMIDHFGSEPAITSAALGLLAITWAFSRKLKGPKAQT